MNMALMILCILILGLLGAVLVLLLRKPQDSHAESLERLEQQTQVSQRQLREEISDQVQRNVQYLGSQLTELQRNTAAAQSQKLDDMAQLLVDRQERMRIATQDSLKQLERRLQTLEMGNEQKLESMRKTMQQQLQQIGSENQQKLTAIQSTVSEKLDNSLQKSFHLVSEWLEKVYESLGEMQTVSAGIGDLKRVLSNVKTRGILGEVQLGSILEEILAPEQYEREISTIPGSRNHVEFAVKLPG